MISVISPTYNCAKFIQRSYFCLRSQSHEDWEWIVVNDGSTDETIAIFEEICKHDSRVKFFNLEKNQGRGFARNSAMQKAKGDIIVIWDIDDLYTSERLLKIRQSIDSGYDFFCSYVLLVNNSLDLKGARHFSSGSKIIPKFVHATLGIKKDIIDSFSLGYDPLMRAGEDLDIMLKLENNHKGFYSEEYLMIYVEDREVNLPKAISANINQLKTIKKILSKGNYKFYLKFKYIVKLYFKLLILSCFYLWPSLYLKTVRYRYSENIISTKLNVQILKLLKGDFK
jgi:glycosyltransferase involved in cell wall biosynthesis